MADQLHVGEVPGGQRVGVAPAVETEALDHPGTDPGDCEQAAVAVAIEKIGAAAGDLPRS